MRPSKWLALVALLAVAAPVAAQDITMSGQVRPRFEFRDPSGGGKDESTSMRVRLGMKAAVDENLTIFVQMQDVRTWGEETHPLFDYTADNLDLHQGYLQYKGQKLDWLTTTVGRMETNLAGERFVGAVDWTQQAQAFDGVLFDVAQDWGNVKFLAYKVGDETAPAIAADKELYGAYATLADVGPGGLDLYWFFDRTEGATETNQHSLGARYAFTGSVNGRFEGTMQTGTRAGADVSAYMFGARLGKSFSEGKVSTTLWYDYLSGDDAGSSENNSFYTLYATNHKFYGFADLFLNLPVDTGGRGLQDMALKLAFRPNSDVSFGADLHSFSAAEQGTLADSHFANELDLTLSHRYTSNLSATVGFSYVMQDDAMATIGRLDENLTWFYVMLNSIF
jgi:alginate export protein